MTVRVLFAATRDPFRTVGGGSLVLEHLIRALPGAGVEARLVALSPDGQGEGLESCPVRAVRGRPRGVAAALPALCGGLPLSLARYRVEALAAAVCEEIATFRPHVLHLDQLHVAWLLERAPHRQPAVLRQHNVESRLLERVAALARPPLRWLLRREARRLRRVEAGICERAELVAAISEEDATALRALAPAARVAVLPAPAPPMRDAAGHLDGDPPCLCIGSFDWLPNRDGARWFLADGWPHLRRQAPGAVLHLAGPGSLALQADSEERLVRHGRVEDATALHDPRAIAVVPVRVGSGVRLRILEAWAAGIPVVTTPQGGEGLVRTGCQAALVAAGADDLAAGVARIAADAELRTALVLAGRSRLAAHAPAAVAAQARALYDLAISSFISR